MSIVNRIVKLIVWFFVAIVVLLAIGYIVLFTINFHDQPPSSAAKRLAQLSSSRTQVEDDYNGYVYLLGFSAKQGVEPQEQGKKYIQWAQKTVSESAASIIEEFPDRNSDFKVQKSKLIRELLQQCRTIDSACLYLLEHNQDSILHWIESNRWLMERYQTLIRYHEWAEIVPYDTRLPLPEYSAVFDAQSLLFTEAWLVAAEGDAEKVKTLLTRDVGFWREVLGSSDILITKMIAVAALKRHFSWSNLVLRALPNEVVSESLPESWQLPITESERSMLRCMTGEWVFSKSMLERAKLDFNNEYIFPEQYSSISSISWILLRPLLKTQDSSNQLAEAILAFDETLNQPYSSYPHAVEQATSVWLSELRRPFPGRAYNLVGDLLLSVSDWNPAQYAVRVTDLEGVRRLALVAAELRAWSLTPQKIEGALKETELRNPYNGEPFLWNEASESIEFHGLEEGERGQHSILY